RRCGRCGRDFRRFLFRGQHARDDDGRDRRILVLRHVGLDALRKLERRKVQRMARLQAREVHLDEFRQVLRKARDLELVHDVLDQAARDLHAGRDLGVDEVQRHAHVDLLVRGHALEVHVQDALLERMHLVIAQQHLSLLAAHLEVEDRGVEGLHLQVEEQLLVVELDGERFLARAVKHAGHLVPATQTAARTRSLHAARFGFDCDLHEFSIDGIRPRPDSMPVKCTYSTNNELTLLSSQILRIVSAISPATLTMRIFSHASASGLSGMVSVTTSSSITDAAMRLTAGPDSTACVQYATTRTAPCSFNAFAASQSVFAVSTMSSMITHVRPFTSPMMFITVATFGRGRRLSMIARSLSSRFAIARARTTPPTSGDTTTWFLYPILNTSPSRIGVA